MLRNLLQKVPHYSRGVPQETAGAVAKSIKVPAKPKPGDAPHKKMGAFDDHLQNIMKDDGYCSSSTR